MHEVRTSDWCSVSALSEEQQRELLVVGDPSERVWAAWALAIRAGGEFAPELKREMGREPCAGVRCQLIVVLAGMGERELLRLCATEDPDVSVRATACQYVIRTNRDGPEAAVDFAIGRMRHDVARVQLAVLEEAQSGRLSLAEPMLAEFLSYPDASTRRLALGLLESRRERTADSMRQLAERVVLEPAVDIRRACITLHVRKGSPEQLLTAVKDAPESVVCEVLTALNETGVRLHWQDLEPVARRPERRIASAVIDLLATPLAPEAFSWMSELAAATHARSSKGEKDARSDATLQLKALTALHQAITPETLPLFDEAVAMALLNWLREMEYWDREYADEFEIEYVAAIDPKRELLENYLSRRTGADP